MIVGAPTQDLRVMNLRVERDCPSSPRHISLTQPDFLPDSAALHGLQSPPPSPRPLWRLQGDGSIALAWCSCLPARPSSQQRRLRLSVRSPARNLHLRRIYSHESGRAPGVRSTRPLVRTRRSLERSSLPTSGRFPPKCVIGTLRRASFICCPSLGFMWPSSLRQWSFCSR